MIKTLSYIIFASFLTAAPIRDHRIDPTVLQKLTHTLEIAEEEDLIAATQKQWLRKKGQERWEMDELSPEKRQFVLDWTKEQGLFAAWHPSVDHYDKAIILGASTPCMEQRLSYLKELWEQGIRFEEIVWLVGDRPLDPRVDTLFSDCPHETAAAHLLWEKASLPSEVRKLPVQFIASPMQGNKRPTTDDTILDWLKTSPAPCTTLFVSSQPFCGYQFAAIKMLLPDTISFDVAGPSLDLEDYPAAPAAAILLDSIARWLYAENIASQK